MWYPQTDQGADFFLYWKMIILVMTATIMCAVFISNFADRHTRKSYDWNVWKIFIPLGVYAILCIISVLFSNYKYFCIHGMTEMYENIWTLLAYAIACLYFFWIVYYKHALQKIVYVLSIGTLLVALICAGQFFKLDIYKLIYSSDDIVFNFAPGQVYGPFYNINYVGSYIVLLFPLFLCLVFAAKKIWMKLFAAVICALYLISIYGAQSIASEIALAGSLLFLVWYLIFRVIKKKKWCLLYMGISVCCVIFGFIMASPYLSAYIQSTDTRKTDLEHVYTRQDQVEIDYRGHQLLIDMYDNNNGELAFDLRDENNQPVTAEYLMGHGEYDYYYYRVTDERFPDFTLVPSLYSEDPIQYVFQLTCDNSAWIFSKDVSEDGSYYWMNANHVWVKLTEDNNSPSSKLFRNMSSLANGRGYIWNKTLPILRHTLLLGTGPDTYALVFPNDDYVDLYNNGYQNLFHVKPHNMYLQVAVQTGGLSLICWLVFYVWYLFDGLKLYYRTKLSSIEAGCGLAIMIGTLGYMITGLANDSTVTVAPVYWALLGIGIAINQSLKVTTT